MRNESPDVLDKAIDDGGPDGCELRVRSLGPADGANGESANNFRGPFSLRARRMAARVGSSPADLRSGANAQTIGNQIVVLPDGTLVDLFLILQNATAPLVRAERLTLAIIRSSDKARRGQRRSPSPNPSRLVSDVKRACRSGRLC